MKFKEKAEIGVAVVCILLFSAYCGKGNEIASNKYFGMIPGFAMKYQTDLDALKEELDECTDRDKYFTIEREIEILKQKADETIDEYMAINQFADFPFEQNDDSLLVVEDIWIDWVHPTGINFKARVTMTEFGASIWRPTQRDFLVYVKILDEEGIQLDGFLMMYSKNDNDPMVAGREVEITGGTNNPASLIKFNKFIFSSMKEYENYQNLW